jgi:LCP family protein required for cell wall assembly
MPHPSSTPGAIHPWGDFPGPTDESEIDIPGPVSPIPFPEDSINILFLGTDRRKTWKWYQTDAIMIASLNPDSGSATLISIPRDLYVYIPGWKVNRINTAEFRGGFEMVADTILYNFGIPLHHWVRVDYHGAVDAIDLLGGIDVHSRGRLKSMCEGISYEYEADVIYHMDGFTAMCYVRMRLNSSDFDRLRRQQEVFRALFDKVISMNGLLKVPKLYDTFRDVVESDLVLEDLLPLIPLASKLALDPSKMKTFRIDYTLVENWRTPVSRAAVLLPKRERIQLELEEIFATQEDHTSAQP